MTLFQASPQEHLALAKHLTAEAKTEEFVVGKGVIVKWERLRKQNHWFDALYNACAAGHYCGVRLVDEVKRPRRLYTAQELRDMACRYPAGGSAIEDRPTLQDIAARERAPTARELAMMGRR
jgi:hypothetical protein